MNISPSRILHPFSLASKSALAITVVASLAACQSSSTQTSQASSEDVLATVVAEEQASAETVLAVAETEVPVQQAAVQLAAVSPAQCSIRLAGGPPPIPPRGADFGEAVASNVGKGAKRGALRILGASVGGQIGALVGDVAANTVRPEQEVRGVWTITDGSPDCGCQIALDAPVSFNGSLATKGKTLSRDCSNPILAGSSTWALGYAFAGYGAKMEFNNGTSVAATMTREGIHYFTGTLADGTPVTMWREKQNSGELVAFKKSSK